MAKTRRENTDGGTGLTRHAKGVPSTARSVALEQVLAAKDGDALALARAVAALAGETLDRADALRKGASSGPRGEQVEKFSARAFNELHERMKQAQGEVLRERHRRESGLSRDGSAPPKERRKLDKSELEQAVKALDEQTKRARKAAEEAATNFDNADQQAQQIYSLYAAILKALNDARSRANASIT